MTATRQSSLDDGAQATQDATRRRGHSYSWYALPLLAASILLAAPLTQAILERQTRPATDADMLWLLHVLAVALLAARWRMRGALLGLTLSLATFALVELALETPANADLTRHYSGLALIALANTVVSLTIGWLAERLSRSDHLRRVSLETAQRLAAAEERYRALVEQLPAVIYTADLSDDASLYVSPESERLFGFRPEAFIERPSLWRELVHPDDRERVFAPVDWAAQGDRNKLEYRVRHRAGQTLWISDDYRVVRQPDGRPAFLQGVVQDITARKTVMERLAAAERRYRSAIEQMPAVSGVALRDEHATTLYVSPQIERMLGYSVAEFLGDPTLWLRTIHPDDRARVLAQHQHTNATGEPFSAEYRAIAKDGSVVWVWDHAVLAPSDDGGERWQWLKFDVTERKQAEAAAREHEARFRAAIDGSSDAFYILQSVRDAQGALVDFIYLDANEQAGALLGLRQRELLGSSYRATLPSERFEHYFPLFERAIETRQPLEEVTASRYPNGDELTIHYHAVPFGDGLAVTTRDITERRRAEVDRLAAEARYRTLVEQMPAVVYTSNVGLPHENLYISPRVQDLLGYSAAEWRADPGLWFTLLHPDDAQRVRAQWGLCGATREPFTVEYRVVARDGHVIWLRDEARVVYDHAGAPLYWQGVWLDITARMEAEVRLRQQTAYIQLLQAVAMAANEAASVEAAIQTTLDQVCRHIGWPIGHALLRAEDPAAGLVSTGIWHLDDPRRFREFRQITESVDFLPGVGLPGRVLETGQASWLRDDRTCAGMSAAELAQRSGVRSGFACPVLVGSEVVAVLEFFTDVVTPTDDALLDVLGQLGGQLGRVVERKRALEALSQSEERFRSLVQHGRDIVVILDGAGQINYATPSMTSLLGYDVVELLGTNPIRLIHPDDQAEAAALLGGLLQGVNVDTPAQARFQHADGAWRYIEAVGVNMLDNPSVRGIVVTARDVTERKQFEAQLEHQAFYDPLTNLPNRALFLNRLDHALALAARGGAAVGVMFLDLDRFKIINDSLGHAVGDQLLQLLGERIQGCLRAGDTLARLGGDEFIILLEGMQSEAEAVVIAERVLDSFRAPYTLAGQEVSLSTSIGIALAQSQRSGQLATPALSGDLLRMADIALYRAKATSRATYAVFDASMNVFSVERLKLESDLRRAIARGELLLHFQPELDLATGTVVGLEALARWEHPLHGLVPPSEFIPIAEETDLIVSIGQWVLQEGCRQACAWPPLTPSGERLTISVNLSARQFQQPDIVACVAGVLRETGIDPALLRLEITESVVVQDAESTIETLRALKALGVKLAIDDFGTGYSSLSYLTRLTVDTLKVDRSFVSGANSDDRSASIVNAVVTLAHALGMQVTAEGIETDEQLARMRGIGCDRGQGYLFARPLAAPELEPWLARRAACYGNGNGMTTTDALVTYVPATHERA